MSRIASFFMGAATGAMLLYAAMNFHVLRSSDGFHLIAKKPAQLSDIYVDVRSFGMSDWTNHPQLASALVQANKQHLIGDSTAGAVRESLNQLLPERPVR